MWKTVAEFQKHGYNVPQFHGKWPFVCVFGMQEPASVFFSILNGMTNTIAYYNYRKRVTLNHPLYHVVRAQFGFAINAWIWSSIFHARDNLWTERLDYFCATSLVMYSLYVSIYRWTFELKIPLRNICRWLAGLFLTVLYLCHISYLSFGSFDYSYNMKLNVAVGLTNSFSWLVFAYIKRKQGHIWRIVATVLLTNIFILLELFDFPPFWWTIDAHSLWHLSTVPLPFLVYRYYGDESLLLAKQF